MTPYERLSRAASLAPQGTALDTGLESFTYAELCTLVDRAAQEIEGLGLPPQSRVALCAVKEWPTYIWYLAILRLGHTVVPLGPDNPPEFQATVARLAGVSLLVADEHNHFNLVSIFKENGIRAIDPQRFLDSSITRILPAYAGAADDVMYILFTSGTTGTPKGVPITNRNVSAYLDRVLPQQELGEGDRLSQAFALTFDPSVFDLFGAWATGATLVVPRKRELLTPARYVNSRGITHWYSVPTLISYAMRIGNLRPGAMPELRCSQFIGEPLQIYQADAWRVAAPNSTLENVYGPTELTISCANYRIPVHQGSEISQNGTVPIGEIYPDLEWSLFAEENVDGSGRLQARGEGELCVRGTQRFSGYLNPDDNAGRFIRSLGKDMAYVVRDGHITVDDWYRTGDRVRIEAVGALVHLGRMDRQVKIRGHRVELGHVESAVRRHPSVLDVAVVARADGHGSKSLSAFLSGTEVATPELRQFLAEAMPDYMIPDSLSWLSELPVNTSGKVDYATLQREADSQEIEK
ncbi:AMP-binding protein [Streptomyces sp. NPDC051362]|uniref:AMP-binding protein n=1 Tax=Streptomyces sp. NPDC051362 TaxID=3365651 RepID=UPI0037AF6D0F